MTVEQSPAISRVVELWRATFGEPPSILLEPAQMLVLIEAHAAAGSPPLDRSQESRI
jgi:hypothetical protein